MTIGRVLAVAAVVVGSSSACAGQAESTQSAPAPTSSAVTSSPTPTSTEPAVTVAGVDPCDLLTPQQRSELGVSNSLGQNKDSPTRSGCAFIDIDDPESFAVIVSTDSSLDGFRSPAEDKVIREGQLQGFPTVVVEQAVLSLCTIAVGIADNQVLAVNQATEATFPMDQMCDRVTTAATAALTTLTTR